MSAVKRSILVFARAPRLGGVKTRLNGALSPERILSLHCDMVSHAVQQAYQCPNSRAELWVDADPGNSFFEQLSLAHPGLAVRVQRGESLGQRMQHALRAVHRRGMQVLIIGSDCPAIDLDYLSGAFERLQSGADVSIGPALDGG